MSVRHSSRLLSGLLNRRLGIWCQGSSLLSGIRLGSSRITVVTEIHHRTLSLKLTLRQSVKSVSVEHRVISHFERSCVNSGALMGFL